VCEPRHASWFAARADGLLSEHRVGRVAADPARAPAAAVPGGWPGIAYFRLHGSPRMYWSVYDSAQLEHWARSLRSVPRRVPIWCIFDNTAASGAAGNALYMQRRLTVGKPLQEAP
jgi:uncharacterized protein YecE (DUF72 family)